MTITKEQNNAALVRLAELFPKTFTAEKHQPHRPLKWGIAADIAARCPDLKRRVRGTALSVYCGRIAYLESLVAGAVRVDLDGNAAGEVTAEEAEYAAGRLAEVLAAREAHPSKEQPARPAGKFNTTMSRVVLPQHSNGGSGPRFLRRDWNTRRHPN